MAGVGPCALITGVTGQDGSYLAEVLLARGYRVVGTTRSKQKALTSPIGPIASRISLVEDDCSDDRDVRALVQRFAPDEISNLAARASSADLFSDPAVTGDINGLLSARLLEAVRLERPASRFFQALSSELYGTPEAGMQSESTLFSPGNPYAVAKLYAYWMVKVYRERYGLHASSGILFNHESPRRALHFVTRKISRAAAMASMGDSSPLELGSLDARRDWSFAGDFAEAMRLMVAAERPDDYVLASGVSHSVADFCELAYRRVGLDYRDHVRSVPGLTRVADNSTRVGDASKARRELGWQARVEFKGLVHMMVDADVEHLKAGEGI